MTTIAGALKLWEKENGSAEEAEEIGLQCQLPPIVQMDENLSKLVNCRMLSLSTNCIKKITGLQGMQNLVIISLARNNISSLAGLEAVGGTLEQLWMSYNDLQHLTELDALPKLQILYITHNRISSWDEVARIAAHGNLKKLTFWGNPLVGNIEEEEEYFATMIPHLPNIQILDGEPVVRL